MSGTDVPQEVERIRARSVERTTPCGEGRMVWRVWGAGPPAVLLHGGSGSWTHWLRTIPALENKFRLYVADIPGMGDSDLPPFAYDSDRLQESTDRLAEVVCAGIAELIPDERYGLVGFSFGSVMGGYVAARHNDRITSFTTIGAAALGVPWPGLTGSLRSLEDGMTTDEIMAVQRHNLHVIMLSTPPDDIDDLAAWLQSENTRRARIRSHMVAPSDILRRALERVDAPLTAIWGREDVFANPNLAERVQVVTDMHPSAAVHILDGVGHWAMYEGADQVNDLVLAALSRHSPPSSEAGALRSTA